MEAVLSFLTNFEMVTVLQQEAASSQIGGTLTLLITNCFKIKIAMFNFSSFDFHSAGFPRVWVDFSTFIIRLTSAELKDKENMIFKDSSPHAFYDRLYRVYLIIFLISTKSIFCTKSVFFKIVKLCEREKLYIKIRCELGSCTVYMNVKTY